MTSRPSSLAGSLAGSLVGPLVGSEAAREPPVLAIARAPAADAAARPRRIESLDHLRVYAALTVLFGHAIHFLRETDAYRDEQLAFYRQGTGALVFMAVAGFIALHTEADRFAVPGAAAGFFRKRMRRLVPLYWVFTTLWLVTALVAPGQIDKHELDPIHIACSYLFLPWPRPFDAVPKPILSPGWTLNYIAWFNALFAVAMLFGRRRGLALASGVLLAVGAVGLVAHRQTGIAAFFTDSYVLMFALGMACVPVQRALARRGFVIPMPASLLAVCALFWLSWVGGEGRGWQDLQPMACATAIVAIATLTGPVASPRFRAVWGALAKASYSIYLSQAFSLGVFVVALRLTGLGARVPFAVATAAAMVFGLVCGLVVHRVVERRL